MSADRLALASEEHTSYDERELLDVYRESCQNDRSMLFGLLVAWGKLSTAHRGLVFRIAAALRDATAWRVGAR